MDPNANIQKLRGLCNGSKAKIIRACRSARSLRTTSSEPLVLVPDRISFMKEHQIAVIPGDGIGREVIPEGIRVLEAVGAKHGIRFKWQELPWSCDWYQAHGRMCPPDAPDILRRFDA